MHNCRICRKPLDDLVQHANDDRPLDPDTIVIPDNEILGRKSTVRRLAMTYRAKELPRRKLLFFVNDHIHAYEGTVIHQGEPVLVEVDVDEVFGTDRDPSERWLGSFMDFAEMPPRQRAQHRVIMRLTLLWLALAVHNPRQAELVVR